MRRRRHWVMMDGLAGAGKSTLAAALAAELRESGQSADLFGEEELFTRAEFAAVAEGFRTGHHADAAMFEGAYQAYLAGLGSDCAVFDWSAAGMSGDLSWALREPAGYVTHLRQVRLMDPGRRLTLLRLCVPARIATLRAAAERGQVWVDRYDAIAVAAGCTGTDPLDRIIAWAEHSLGQAERERAAVAAAGWRIVDLDASPSPDAVAREALTRITG